MGVFISSMSYKISQYEKMNQTESRTIEDVLQTRLPD